MLHITLNFRIYVWALLSLSVDQDQQCHCFVKILRSLVSLPRENCPAITNAIASASTILGLPQVLCKIGLFLLHFHFSMPDGSLERKSSSEEVQ